MSNLTPMSEYLKGLPTMVKREDCAILNLVGGILKTIPQHILQETACQLRGAANTINLDTDKVCGFFSLRQCSGTKPTEYGVAIVFGGGSDFYQLVIGSNGRIYHRANINNIPKPWLCLANDASYVSPTVGGGVKRYRLITYAITLKGGGLRDEYDDNADFQSCEVLSSFRDSDCKGKDVQYERNYPDWNISDYEQCRDSSNRASQRSVWLWKLHSVRRAELYGSVILSPQTNWRVCLLRKDGIHHCWRYDSRRLVWLCWRENRLGGKEVVAA